MGLKLKIVANPQRACLRAGASMARPAGSRGWRSGRITSSKINAIASHGYRHSIAKAGVLPDGVGQGVRVYRFFQVQDQRFYVVARQAAVGEEAFAHHATLLHRAKQVLVVAEGAAPADVDQPVLLGRHDGDVCAVHHFAHARQACKPLCRLLPNGQLVTAAAPGAEPGTELGASGA